MSERIVVLDGYTLSSAKPGGDEAACPPGEPGWGPIEALGELTVYDRTPDDLILERARDAAILLTNKTPLSAETIGELKELQYVGVLATGVNVVDLDAAKRAGVVVTNVPGYSGDAVAQHVIAMLLAMTNRVAEHDRAVHGEHPDYPDGWAGSPDFCFTLGPIPVLTGKVLGIVGAGDIGRRVARIGHALGMRLIVHSRTRRELDVPAEWVSVDELFKQADVITLHAPLTDQTRQMVNADRLKLMKRSALLINTGRGPLLDEQAVADALTDGRIAGCAVDVLSSEPPEAENPLLRAPNCTITPHNAWAAVQCRHRLMQIAADNLRAFLVGEPVNVVNG